MRSAAARPQPDAVAEVAARYGLELDFESIPRLCQQYGLRF